MSARALILSLLLATSTACNSISCPPETKQQEEEQILEEPETIGPSFLLDPEKYDMIETGENDRYGCVGALMNANGDIACSAVLINSKAILTSQHCFGEDLSHLFFMTQNGKAHLIKDVFFPNKINPGLPFNDLALCILEAECEETPAKLVQGPFELRPGEELTTVGWSLGIKKVSQPGVVKYYGSLIEEGGQVMRMLATKGSVFYGDSGGAVFEDGGLLAGIICFFGMDAETGVIVDNGAVRLDYFKKWIDETLKENCLE